MVNGDELFGRGRKARASGSTSIISARTALETTHVRLGVVMVEEVSSGTSIFVSERGRGAPPRA